MASVIINTIWLPATEDRPAEPAPFMMTDKQVARLLQLRVEDPRKVLWQYRRKGWLRAIPFGNELRYRLTDVLKLIDRIVEENPR